MEISIAHLQAFLIAVQHFPPLTPKRCELVGELVLHLCKRDSEKSSVHLSFSPSSELEERKMFTGCAKDCANLASILIPDKTQSYKDLFFMRNFPNVDMADEALPPALKPVVLVPFVEMCCGERLRIFSRPAFPTVYTLKGTLIAALFHGQCKICRTTYYYSYKEKINAQGEHFRIYNNPDNDQTFFQCSSASIFEKALLNDFTSNIVFSGATFDSREAVYRANNTSLPPETLFHEWYPSSRTIQETWFLWCIIKVYAQTGKLCITYTESGKKRNLEGLCETLWEEICQTRNKWVMHRCGVKGCAEGYVTVDGNEKLWRPTYAAPCSKLKIQRDLPMIVQCCTNSPQIGGRRKSSSRFCPLHTVSEQAAPVATENSDVEGRGKVLPEFSKVDIQTTGVLPDNDDVSLLVGCKQPHKLSKWYDRTAGMLALVRPCGIVVSMCEMFTCESPTQVFLFVLRTFVHDTTPAVSRL